MYNQNLSPGGFSSLIYSNRTLKRLLVPLVIEQVLVMLVGMVDTVMVASAGEAAVSGVALVDMVNYLIITVMAALTTGGSVIISQYAGGRQPEQAERSAGQLMTATLLLSAAIPAVCLLGRDAILRLFFGSVEADVMAAAQTYFMITACSFPFLGIYDAGAALYRVMGKTSVTMYVSLAMNVVNVAGDFIGVSVLHAGVAGVAVPTLLSRAFAAVVMSRLAFRRQNSIPLYWHHILMWDTPVVRRILHIAVPNGLENGLFALGKVLVTSIVAGFGTVQIAANGVANSVDQIAVIVVNAVNLAMVPVVGQCVGASDYTQAAHYTEKLMRISYLFTAVLGLAVCVLLPVLLPLYGLSAHTLRLAALLIVLHNALALLLHPTSFNLANSLRAAGDARFTMIVGICSMIVFRLGSALLFGKLLRLRIVGVWIAMGMDWLARSIAFTIRYKSGKWKEKRAI